MAEGNNPETHNLALKKIAALRDQFLANLDDRLIHMGQSLDGVLLDGDATKNLRALEVLLGLAHKLRGAAGVFDLPEITSIASQLEQKCKDLLADPGALDKTGRKALLELFVGLRSASIDSSSNAFIDAVSWETLATASDKSGADTKKIIIVDDDIGVIKILRSQLSHFGFAVEHLIDYRDLKPALAAGPPAVLIMDVAFPGDIDAGVKTIEQLKDDGLLACPVVFLSVRGDFQARLSSVRAGCDGYLTKPVDIIELVDLMERLSKKTVEDAYRVILVDDDPEVAGLHAAMLEKVGMETAVVCDPMEVMGPIRELQPDVILMDISMPDCNGFELAKVIRQNQAFVKIPIIFLSGAEIDEAWIQSMQSGGDEFLRKDISPRELVASVLARARRSRNLNVLINRLGESELRFRAVTETAREAIITTDHRGRIIYWNRGARDTFGYDNAEILGHPVTDLIPERLRVNQQTGFETVARQAKDVFAERTFETSGLTKSGAEIAIEISLAEWQITGKTYMTGIIRDVSQRKSAEEDRARLLSAVESSGEGIILYDGDDRLIYANQKYRDLYPVEIPALSPGTSFRDIVKRTAYEGGVVDAQGRQLDWLEERVITHQSPGHISEQKTTRGRWVRIHELRTDEGGVFGVHTDITDLKQAREEAEKANRTKSEFLSSMSHELRTPLTSSIGSLGLLNASMASGLSTEARELLEIALRNNQSLLRLVNELLDYEKILSGTLAIETRPHDLCELLENTLDNFRGFAQTQSIELVFDRPAQSLVARVQEHRFEQVLNNLLSNAAKFSTAGSTVEIFLGNTSGTLRVGVKDQGPGIPTEFRDRIYDQFTQADSSSTRTYSGTGLGLAISKALTEGMGGTLSFETEIGVGSTFFVTFPEHPEAAAME